MQEIIIEEEWKAETREEKRREKREGKEEVEGKKVKII